MSNAHYVKVEDVEELAALCVKFKQERDDAREELKEYRSIAESIGAKKAVSEKEKAIRERDEVLEELNDIRINLGEDAEGHTLLHAVCALQNERDDLYYKLQDAKQSLEVALTNIKRTRGEDTTMKATLEFNLPEEQCEHEYAVHGVDALLLISDLEGELRAMVNDDCGEFKKWRNEDEKECHGDYETLQRVWDFIIRQKESRRLPELI